MEKICPVFVGFGLLLFLFLVVSTFGCTLKDFTCDNSRCVKYIYRCDGDNDCRDYSDERCEPFLDHFLVVADNGQNRRDSLYQIDLNTDVMLPLKVTTSEIDALAFDDRTGDVYWTIDSTRSRIERYTLTRSRRTETIFNATGTLEGLALDLDGDRLYYCGVDSGGRRHGLIGQMFLNGTDHRIIVSERGARPRSIVLDTVNRLMYWIDAGSRPSIVRAQMDNGSDRTVIVRSNIKEPRTLAIDTKAQLLYWGDAGHHRVERLRLTESGDRRVILDESARNASYHAFALGPDFLYLTDRKQGSLRKLHLGTLKVYDQPPEDVFTRLTAILYYNSYGATPLFQTSLVTASFDNQDTSVDYAEAVTSVPSPHEIEPASNGSSVATVITVVIGVVAVTVVITVGVVLVKARRTRKLLLLEKRLVVPPSERTDNSYFYSPFDGSTVAREPSSSMGANGAAGTGTTGLSSLFFSANPFFRMAATRTSSFKPIIGEDVLQTNNVYSTVVGDYENVDTYDIIEDPLV